MIKSSSIILFSPGFDLLAGIVVQTFQTNFTAVVIAVTSLVSQLGHPLCRMKTLLMKVLLTVAVRNPQSFACQSDPQVLQEPSVLSYIVSCCSDEPQLYESMFKLLAVTSYLGIDEAYHAIAKTIT